MIISPPFLRPQGDSENDELWVNRMMPIDPNRGYPINTNQSWHGGIHIRHTDSGATAEKVRAIADGEIISVRLSSVDKKNKPPFKYIGSTDSGYVLIKHETEIGSGDDGKIVFYSLYMHLSDIESAIQPGAIVYRKSSLGTVGQVDGNNAVHVQVFCDSENISKITGRVQPELDITKNGRADIVYGDVHFYIPAGTRFYDNVPKNKPVKNSPYNPYSFNHEGVCEENKKNNNDFKLGLEGFSGLYSANQESNYIFELDYDVKYISEDPLFITMSFSKGNCTMVTRRKSLVLDDQYLEVGEPLVNADGENYEYNLYQTALELYPKSPSAGYEMLRFGRIINIDHETLSPADAPLWRTINYPEGKGIVNLAAEGVRVFSDGDFPHWMGWHLVDDDTDNNSQCNSQTILCSTRSDLSRMICHFPLEWDKSTVESRFEWLKLPNDLLPEPMTKCDWTLLTEHGKALCLENNPLPSGRFWHFDPRPFITHFRKCEWINEDELSQVYPDDRYSSTLAKINLTPLYIRNKYLPYINQSLRKYFINTPSRKSHFFAQGAVESFMMALMVEGAASFSRNPLHSSFNSEIDGYYNPAVGGYLDYLNGRLGNIESGDGPKFRGRGFKQVTGRLNYSKYWVYRGWIDISIYPMTYRNFTRPWWGKNSKLDYAPVINNPQILSVEPYCSIDASAWYWSGGSASAGYRSINRKIIDGNLTFEHSRVITYAINGGYSQDSERWQNSVRIFGVLGDGI